MTTNRPRFFQVVPVTGVFNRGRWECWDYKEGDDTTETKENDTFITERSTVFVPTSSTATSISAEAMNAVAIDNKIEQAMDLVKTHLTLAVRDEIEHLRAKIVKLETEVVRLDVENSILRNHVPVNILQDLSFRTREKDDMKSTSSDKFYNE